MGDVRMVCFDAGGVLVRICRSWRERCERAGLEFRWAGEAEADTQAWMEAHTLLETGRMAPGVYFDEVRVRTGGLYTPEELRAMHVAWIIDEYPGVGDLVRRLGEVPDVSTGLLSNTNEVHWATAPMMGSAGSAVASVDHPHASHLLGLTKPGREIFRAFERATGFGSGDILFFEDTAANIDAARDAGWRAELIDHVGDTSAQMASHLAAHGVRI